MWKSHPPATPGLYIASVDRRPGYVRCWTGKHWTAPTHVGDMQLPGRMPAPDWPVARDEYGRMRRVEWLEPFTVDAEGFIAWGGLTDINPVRPRLHAAVDVKLRSGARTEWPVPASGFRWRADGSCLDPVAYRVVAQ